MDSAFVPFAMPDIGEEEIAEVVDSLKSGWITTGPKTKAFETQFSHFVGGGVEAVAVNSATAGLHLALEAVGVGPGDEVITTPYTFTATAEVIRYLGADPVFVDIDEATLNIDPKEVLKAITSKTKAIVPVHIGGLACDMEPILNVARRAGVKVIEDAAHAFPATYRGTMIGRLGSDATVYSFYATKTITTGEGGMIVTRNRELAARCRMMRLHGIDRDVFDRYTSPKSSWRYEVMAPGYKYNMTDIAASIGIHQLKKTWIFQRARESIANRYTAAFQDLGLTLPCPSTPGDYHSWHLYIIRLVPGHSVGRDEFIERMRDLGICCSVHFIPLHVHPYWQKRYCLKPSDYQKALAVYEGAVSLPIYPRMTDSHVRQVIDGVRNILKGS